MEKKNKYKILPLAFVGKKGNIITDLYSILCRNVAKMHLLAVVLLLGCENNPLPDNTAKVHKGDTIFVYAINGIHGILILNKHEDKRIFEIKYLKTNERDYISFDHLNGYLQDSPPQLNINQ